jgi:hypothetical protein
MYDRMFAARTLVVRTVIFGAIQGISGHALTAAYRK